MNLTTEINAVKTRTKFLWFDREYLKVATIRVWDGGELVFFAISLDTDVDDMFNNIDHTTLADIFYQMREAVSFDESVEFNKKNFRVLKKAIGTPSNRISDSYTMFLINHSIR